jgi:chromosome segregation ATPase
MERSQSKNAAEYIATMESAMSQSESDIKEFNRKLERLEAELKRKEDSHLELQERIKLVDTTEDNQLLLKELEEKNVKLANLERDLEDSIFSKQTLGEERDLLRRQTDEQTRQLAVLQSRVDQVPKAVADGSSIIVSKAQRPLSVSQVNDTSEDDSPGNVPGSPTTPVAAQHSLDSNQAGYTVLNPEVVELQEKHAQTLAELAAISDRYKEALEKITELTRQVVEAEEANRDSSDSGKDVSPSSMAISRTASASSIASAVSASPERARRTRSVGNELVVKPDKTDFQRGRGDRMGDTR